ncbi:MAG: sulfatase-like hydrolase/transferase [Sandaracinus sp.]|nr:sulfatase-like hydrolase/transferase [Sandaracinus sp.]MCB9619113.1 sulfatase-like hydrolase/transferase [Sandaracinus sp.]MCB9632696.1 sulfatase-like hydrolase/transferase [Sandaracinus sp.]
MLSSGVSSGGTDSKPRVAIRPPEGDETPTPHVGAPPRASDPPRASTPPRRDPTPSAPFGTESRESLLPEEPADPPSALSLAACFAAIGAIVCGLEALFAGVGLADLWLATSIGLFAGTLLGATVAAATVPPLRYLPRIGPMVAMLAGAAAGVPFVAAPGMFEPLIGANGRVVWAALVVGPLTGALVGFVLGRAVQLRSMFFALVLSGGALILLFLEPRLIALPAYPAAAWGIRLVPWGAAALALHQLRRRNAPPIAKKPKIALVAIWTLLAASPWLYAGRTRGQLDEVLALRHAQLGVMLARTLTDFDGDGASRYFGGGDCNDADPHVGPRAPEIAGNGVDDNCRGGDLPTPPPRVRVGTPPTTTPPENAISVVLVTIDTLRVDRVGSYGYPRETTPSLDELAHRGRRFERAYSAGGWTAISLPALLRGVPARELRWERLFATDQRMVEPLAIPSLGPRLRVKSAVLVVRDERPTLAAQLAARGYRTAAVVDSGGNAFLLPGFGLDDGFERFDAEPIDDDTAVADRSLAALREIGDAPFFLWAHFYGPHAPDRRHADAPDFGGGSSERYDHEIAHADVQVGRILAAVAERDDVVVIVTADHGEILGPLTRAHGNDLNPYTVRVPLIVAGAGVERGVETEAAGFVDVAQTVLAVTGVADAEGGDLRTPLGEDRHVIMDTWRFDARGRATLDLSAIGTSDELVIRDRLLATDYAVDPDDLERVPERRRPRVELVQALDTYLENARPFPRTRP